MQGQECEFSQCHYDHNTVPLKDSCYRDAPLNFCFHIKQILLLNSSVSCEDYPKVNILLWKRFTSVCTNYSYHRVKKALQLLKYLQGSVLCSLSGICPCLAARGCNRLLDLSTQVTKFC